MMKALFALCLLFLLSITAFTQVTDPRWALSAGIGGSTISAYGSWGPSGRIALSHCTDLCRRLSFKPEIGLSLSQSSSRIIAVTNSPNTHQKLNSRLHLLYIDVTPAVSINLTQRVGLQIGPYAAYLAATRSSFKQQTITNGEVVETYRESGFGNGFYRYFDMGLRAKAELQVSSRISLFGQTSYGFVNIFPNANGPFSREDPFLHLITAHLGLKWSLPGRAAKIKDYRKSLPNFQDAIQP